MIEFVVTEDITKEFGLHNHTGHYVISFITKGKATVFYNNVSVVLAKGDTFIIRPYMPHSVAVENGSQILSMCIKKDLFSAQSIGEISQTVSTKFDEIAAETSLETGIKSELNDAVRLIAETIGDERYKLSADIQKVADKNCREILRNLFAQPTFGRCLHKQVSLNQKVQVKCWTDAAPVYDSGKSAERSERTCPWRSAD